MKAISLFSGAGGDTKNSIPEYAGIPKCGNDGDDGDDGVCYLEYIEAYPYSK